MGVGGLMFHLGPLEPKLAPFKDIYKRNWRHLGNLTQGTGGASGADATAQ